MTEEIDLFNLEKRLLSLERMKDRVAALEHKIEKYDRIFVNFLVSKSELDAESLFENPTEEERLFSLKKKMFQKGNNVLDELEKHEKMGITSPIGIIERATELLKDKRYENYSAIDMLVHIYRLMDSWKPQLRKVPALHHYWNYKDFDAFHKDFGLYLKFYYSPKGKESFILDRNQQYQWFDDDGELKTMPSINMKLEKFSGLVDMSEGHDSRAREAHKRYIFMEWMLGMQ